MFRINPFKTSKEEMYVPNKVRASVRTNLITISQPHVITKKDVNFDSSGLSSTRVDNTAKTRRPQLRSNTKNDRVPYGFQSSCIKNKEVEVEDHPSNLLLSKNKKHISSKCNNVKLAIWNSKSEVVCTMCKQCLITANHDVCVLNYLNDMNSHGKKQKANVSNTENQKKQKPKVMKPNKVGSNERVASPKPSKPRMCLRWSPTGRIFNLRGKIIESSDSECKSDNSIEVTPSSYGVLWSNENCKHKWKVAEAIATVCYTQNHSIIYRRFNKTPYELINGKKPIISFLHVFGALCYPKNDREDIRKLGAKDISFLHVFGALCYPKNDREDIGKLGAKGDIKFFIGYSADSCSYRIYNRQMKKIMETMNVSFDELFAMAFEQRSSKLRLQCMTSRQISSGLNLTYAPSTIMKQQPTEGELDLL
nr:hypothetical protein [Tanacetum cinerariifolium]